MNTEQYGQQLLESLFVVLGEPTNTIDQSQFIIST